MPDLMMSASVDIEICQECKMLETARVRATIQYRDLMAARKEMLHEGHPVTPSRCAALVKAEIRLNEAYNKLAEHQSTHGGE